MNYHLKRYIHSVKTEAIRLGYRLRVDETSYETIALVSNTDTDKVSLVSFTTNLFGDTKIRAYIVNRKKYEWAAAEGFSFNEMVELVNEKIFLEVDPQKLSNYLL